MEREEEKVRRLPTKEGRNSRWGEGGTGGERQIGANNNSCHETREQLDMHVRS